MTIGDYLRVLRERWTIIAISVLLGIAGAIAVFLLRPPEYTANVSLYVSAQVGDNPSQAFQGAQLSEQRVKSYNELVTGDRVLSETITRLNLTTSPQQLSSDVSASSGVDSVIITITATSKSAQQAAAIANTLGTVTSQVVDELERPAAPNGIAPVAIRLVQPAAVPTSPSSIGLPFTIALGLLAGLIVGIVVAFVRNSFDNTVRSLSQLSQVAGAPSLGTVAYNASVVQQPLTIHGDQQGPRAESFRQIRTNLQYIDVDRASKVVVLTSPMPEEGKSTTVANLAIALGLTGSRVLVIEADLRRPRVCDLLGLDRSVGLTRILAGRMNLRSGVQPWQGGSFDVLASGPLPPNPSELLASRQMADVLDEARSLYDYVLIDSPPLLPVTDTAALAPATDGAVLVCRFNRTTKQQVQDASDALKAVSSTVLGTIFNMVPERGGAAYSKYNTYYGAADQKVVVEKPTGNDEPKSPQPSARSRVGSVPPANDPARTARLTSDRQRPNRPE